MKSQRIFLFIILISLLVSIGLFAQAPNILWTKTYGGTDPDVGNSVKQTSDGGYVIAANTESFGSYVDAWLIKTDGNGDTIWTNLFDSGDFNEALDAQQTSDGGYIVCGCVGGNYWLCKTDSTADSIQWQVFVYYDICCLTGVIETSDNGYIASGWWESSRFGRAILLKTDSLGNVLWNKDYKHGGVMGHSKGFSVLQTADGGYVAGGDDGGHFYYFKTDSLGEVIWYTILDDGQNYMRAYSVEQAHDGGFILVGYKGPYLYIVRSDSTGDTLWTKTYGRSDVISVGNSIKQTSDGCYIITGYTAPDSVSNDDVWLLKINAIGDAVWTGRYGGTAEDRGRSVRQTTDGGYIIVGYTNSSGAGIADIWLIKTEPDVGVEEDESIPITNDNPTATVFCGPLLLPKGKDCKVYNITGRKVDPKTIIPGVYFIEIDGKPAGKVVKVR